MTIQYPTHSYKLGLLNFKHYEWICVPTIDSEPQTFDKLNCFRIMTVENTISKWSDKFKDTVSKNVETASVPYI